MSGCRAVGLSGCRAVGLSGCRAVGLSGCRAVGLSGCRAVGLSGCRAVGLSGCRAVGLSGCRAVGLSLFQPSTRRAAPVHARRPLRHGHRRRGTGLCGTVPSQDMKGVHRHFTNLPAATEASHPITGAVDSRSVDAKPHYDIFKRRRLGVKLFAPTDAITRHMPPHQRGGPLPPAPLATPSPRRTRRIAAEGGRAGRSVHGLADTGTGAIGKPLSRHGGECPMPAGFPDSRMKSSAMLAATRAAEALTECRARCA